VALERQGQLWPCTRRPDESWRCDRAGGHKALWRDAARGCLQLGPWDRGAVILQGEPPPGSNALVLGWEGEQAARLTLEPGARALALRPGQHQQAVALPARPRRWSLRLAAGAPPGLCLTWRWRAPYAAPDQEGWEAQVKAGRARLSQGASAQEVLLGYARGGAAQPPGSPPAP
jgi:hypothetical protein